MLVLKGGLLIDGNGGDPVRDAALAIEGARLRQVGPTREVAVPDGAEVIELGNCTLMPGLIDCHVHLMAFNVVSFRNYRVATFETTPQLQMMYGLLHAQLCFEMGFTTLRDVGWVSYAGARTPEMLAVRDAIAQGIVAGPRLLVAGWAVVTGSHLDVCLPGNAPRPAGMTADGPWELRKAVRSNLRMGCDLIKTCASGGAGTEREPPGVRNMAQEELNALVEEAHFFHKPVACHCFTPEAQRAAVTAGVDTIEHCVFTDEEALAMVAEAGTPVVPTLARRGDRVLEGRRRTGGSPFVLEKARALQPHTRETFNRMRRAGIKMAMGTDVTSDLEMGRNAMELEVYVDHGMTPMEAIQTATKNAAEAIGLGGETGTLEAGRYADVLAVDGNPLEEIGVLQRRDRIQMVMKEGRVYVDKRPGHEGHVIHDQSRGWKPL